MFAWYEQAGGRIRIVDRTGASVQDVATAADHVEAIALSADGSRLVFVEDRPQGSDHHGWLVVRGLPDGELITERHLGPWGYRIGLSADGERVAIGDARGGLTVQTTVDGETVWTAPDDPTRRWISALERSPDGRVVRAGANLGTGPVGRTMLLTYQLDAPEGTAPEATVFDTDRISAIATTDDGLRTVIAAADGQTRDDGRLILLYAGDERPSGSLGAPADNHATLRFDPAGLLLSGGPAAGWFAWTVDPAEWEQRACSIAQRELTEAEWRDALGDEPWRPTCDPDATPPPTSSPGPGATTDATIAP
jgi:hypothetical protein